MIPVVYLAHRVGAADRAGVELNLQSARRWFGVLLELWPAVSLVAPWLEYLAHLDDHNPAHRARGMRDQRAVVRRCDGIVLTGPEVSRGMAAEIDVALEARAFVLYLVGVDLDNRAELLERIASLGQSDRRVLGEVR